jgi:hypothetical protein
LAQAVVHFGAVAQMEALIAMVALMVVVEV